MVRPDKQDIDLPNRAVGLAKGAPKYAAYNKDGHPA